MGIQIRQAKSAEMEKNIRTVQHMTKGMCFDENMEKVNWSFVRGISNFGYQFMPKEKGGKIQENTIEWHKSFSFRVWTDK